jgi:hypothetical protein
MDVIEWHNISPKGEVLNEHSYVLHDCYANRVVDVDDKYLQDGTSVLGWLSREVQGVFPQTIGQVSRSPLMNMKLGGMCIGDQRISSLKNLDLLTHVEEDDLFGMGTTNSKLGGIHQPNSSKGSHMPHFVGFIG